MSGAQEYAAYARYRRAVGEPPLPAFETLDRDTQAQWELFAVAVDQATILSNRSDSTAARAQVWTMEEEA